jgi:hypothetical protein
MYIHVNLSLISYYNEKRLKKKVVEKMTTHISPSTTIFFPENRAVYEIM